MLSRDVAPVLEQQGSAYPYRQVKALFLNDDLTVGNLECPLTAASAPAHKNPVILFRAEPAKADALKTSGFDLLNLANNHTMDYGSPGLKDTLEALRENSLVPLGAEEGYEHARAPVFVEKGGTVFGFLGYSAFPAEGYIHTREGYDVARADEALLPGEIAAAKAQCEILIVTVHWGKEFQHYASAQQKKLAHAMIDAGADLIVGHHPHVLQGVEKYKGRFIVYSLGNFVFDRQIPEGTDEGAILQAVYQDHQLVDLSLIPIVIREASPEFPAPDRRSRMLEALSRYSEGLDSDLKESGRRWTIR